MSDNHRPASLPRLSVTLDAGTARAIILAAAERMQTCADFIRDAVAHELSIRQAAADAVRSEVERQGAAARRLTAALARGPGTMTRLTATRVADLSRPDAHVIPNNPTHRDARVHKRTGAAGNGDQPMSGPDQTNSRTIACPAV